MAAPDSSFMVPTLSTSSDPLYHDMAILERSSSKGALQKRRQQTLSCAECRRLKLKFSYVKHWMDLQSRSWPCTMCCKRSVAHLCPELTLAKDGKGARTKELSILYNRIQELETALASYQTIFPIQDDPNSPSTSGTVSDSQKGQHAKEDSQESGLLDTIGSLTLDEERARYLGPGSSSAYFSQDQEAGDEDDQEDEADEFANESVYDDDYSREPVLAALTLKNFPFDVSGTNTLRFKDFLIRLPVESEGKRLANIYFDYVSPIWEPLQRDVFERLHFPAAYDPMPTQSQRPTHPHRLAVVFAILALGTLFDTTRPNPHIEQSHRYLTLAQTILIKAKFLTYPTMASIQCLILICIYHLNTSKMGQETVWPLSGLAMRLGQAMGFHRDPGAWSLEQPECDQRRLVWHECMLFEALQALALGRPCAIDDKHKDTRVPSGEGLRWTKGAIPGNHDGERGDFHMAKFKLTAVLHRVVDQAFGTGKTKYETILKLDQEIRTFRNELSATLSYSPSDDTPTDLPTAGVSRLTLQKHVLTVWISQALLFLHRSYFAQALQDSADEPLKSPFADSVVTVLLEASQRLVAVARSARKLYPKVAGRMWSFNVDTYGGAVCQAALVMTAPGSLLAPYAWKVLDAAVLTLSEASTESVLAAELLPKLEKLQEHALLKLQTHFASPLFTYSPVPNDSASGLSNPIAAETDEKDLRNLGGNARLNRGFTANTNARTGSPTVRSSTGSVSPSRLPRISQQTFHIPPRHLSFEGIAPSVVDRMRSIDPSILIEAPSTEVTLLPISHTIYMPDQSTTVPQTSYQASDSTFGDIYTSGNQFSSMGQMYSAAFPPTLGSAPGAIPSFGGQYSADWWFDNNTDQSLAPVYTPFSPQETSHLIYQPVPSQMDPSVWPYEGLLNIVYARDPFHSAYANEYQPH